MEKETDEQTDPNLQEPSGYGWGSNKTFAYISQGPNHISESFFTMT